MSSGWARAAGVLALGCLAAAAGVTVAAAAVAVGRPWGLDYAEAVVYGQATRVVLGEALYQPIDQAPFTVAAYTPLYYWLAAGLQALVGPGFGPGRALSLGAGLLTAALVGVTAGAGRSGGWYAGAFAGLGFLALAFPGPVPWLGLYRVDLVGVALSVGCVAVLAARTGPRAVLVAGVLAGLALLCKQSFFAALAAGTLWTWQTRRDWRSAGAFIGAALLTVGVPCLVLTVTSSGAFLENTVLANVNPFHPAIAAGLAPVLLETQWLPVLLACGYLVVQRPWQEHGTGRLLVGYWAFAAVSLVGLAKVGAGSNYWIELAAATAMLAGRGAASLLRSAHGSVAGAAGMAVIVAIAVSLGGPDGIRAAARAVRAAGQSAGPNAEFDALVARVRQAPGEVIAEPMDVVVLAGRPIVLEPFIYNLLLDAGRWRPEPLLARICGGQVGLLVLAYPVEVGARMTDGLYALWPAPVIAALQRRMVLDGVQATRYVYTPRPERAC